MKDCYNNPMRVVILNIALLFAAATARAQFAEDPNAAIKALFPKNEDMPRLHLAEIASRLGLRAGSRVADVGCGQGELALIWSRVVGPTGHVWAEDIDRHAVKSARKLARTHHARNIEVQLGDAADPRLPAGGLDAISLTYVYHELVKYPEMLARFHAALKPDGRLAILDPLALKTATRPRADQTKNHVMMPDLAQEDLRRAGFEVLSRDDHFVDDPDSERILWLIVARPVPGP